MPTNNATDLALELTRSITEVRNQMRQFIQARIRESDLDLTFEMLETIACLWRRDGINQQELADITIKDKSSMTYLVDNLEKRNMVRREADSRDRRNNLIYLTREGKQLEKKLNPWLHDMHARATVGMTETDIRQSILLIKKMTDNMKGQDQ